MGEYEEEKEKLEKQKEKFIKQIKKAIDDFEPENVIMLMGKRKYDIEEAEEKYKLNVMESVPPHIVDNFIKVLLGEANRLKQRKQKTKSGNHNR